MSVYVKYLNIYLTICQTDNHRFREETGVFIWFMNTMYQIVKQIIKNGHKQQLIVTKSVVTVQNAIYINYFFLQRTQNV